MVIQENTWNVANRMHSNKDSDNPALNHIITGADEIYDDAKGAKQSDINAQTDDRLNEVETDMNASGEGIKDRVHTLEEQVAFEGEFEVENTPQGIVTGNGKLTSANAVRGAIDVRTGYFVCESTSGTATKEISAPGFVLSTGGNIKIKMTNANTADNATLNINSTEPKPLYYDGERASATNTWEAGETVEVYYDGTSYYANNVAGGSGSGDGAFDVSAKYPTSGVGGGNTYTLKDALVVLNDNLSASKKKRTTSIKFIQSSDSKYVQYFLKRQSFSPYPRDWEKINIEDDVWQLTANQLLYKNTEQNFSNLMQISGDDRKYLCIICSTEITNVSVKVQRLPSSESTYTIVALLNNGTLKQGDNYFYVDYDQDYYLYVSLPSNVTKVCLLHTMKQDLVEKFTDINNSITTINTSLNGKANKTDVNAKFEGVDEILDKMFVDKTAKTSITAAYTSIDIATQYLCIYSDNAVSGITISIHNIQSQSSSYKEVVLSNGTLRQGRNVFKITATGEMYLYINSFSGLKYTFAVDAGSECATINTSLNGKANKTDVNNSFNNIDETLDNGLYLPKTEEVTISNSYTSINIVTPYLCIDSTADVTGITISIHSLQSQSSLIEYVLRNGSLRKGRNVFKIESTGENYLYVSSTSGLKYSFEDVLATKINENTTGLANVNNKITAIGNEITDVLGVEICDFTTTVSVSKILDHPLIPNIEYIFEIRNSVPNASFRFSTTGTSTGAVAFILDGERITGWISPIQAGVHTLQVESNATYLLANGATGSNPGSFHIYKKNVNEDIKELTSYTENIKKRTDFMYSRNHACIDDYINSVGVKNWASLINGKALANNMLTGEIGVIRPEELAHDSQIVVKNGIAYVVFSSNTELIDNPTSLTCKTILSVFALNDFENRTDIVVAEYGSHSEGGAGTPNMCADASDDDLLHIIYIGREDSKVYIYTCDYSISGATCSNYRKVVLHKGDEYCYTNGAAISELFNKTVGGVQANSSIAYLDGWYYMSFVKTSYTNLANQFEVVFKTQNFTDWYYFADTNVLDNPCAYEVAVGTDGTYIYTASRPNTGGTQYNATFGVICKWDNLGNLLARSYYRNCSSRPAFFNYNGNLYLFTNRWYRAICDIIKIDAADIQRSELVFQFKYPQANYYYHYPSFAMNGSNIVTSSSAFFITINQFSFPTLITEDGVYNKIEDMFLT